MPDTNPNRFSLVYPAVCQRAIRQGAGIVFLVWHDLVPVGQKLVWFDTDTREFTTQLRQLQQDGMHPLSLAVAQAYLRDGKPTPPPGATVLCFDDNTTGIHDFAAPVLAAHGWPFVVSAHTAFVGRRTGKAHNSWDALRAMERRGATQGATIVSQTHTHPPDLRLLSDTALHREMAVSKAQMEAALGHAVRTVTYPSGKWDERVARAAQAAGYAWGLTEDNGVAETSPHCLGLHRYSSHKRFREARAAVRRSSLSVECP